VKELVFAIERAEVAIAMKQAPVAIEASDADRLAATGAVASRYLAVGTPRSIGLVGDQADALRSLAAHRTWFAPTDIRCTGAAIDGGRLVSLAEALAADIVCVHEPIALTARALRRGTHVNVLVPGFALDAELAQIAVVSRRDPDLARLAAGLVDGRQLDEITIFLI
jgi:hypothetical protein